MSTNEHEATEAQHEETSAETNETAEPKRRDRSTIAFPYHDLDEAIGIVKGIYAIGGTTCEWDQLAAMLKMSAKGGGFRTRMLAARMFGVLDYSTGTITLTNTGSRLCDPQQEKAARVEAFMNVPLYSAVHQQFKGGTLPPVSGLESTMMTLGVASKQKGRARQVFHRSATQAGFFAFGSDRLVEPNIKANHDGKSDHRDEDVDGREDSDERKDKSERHPLIEGLIRTLPQAEKQWTLEERRKWLQAAANIFDLIFTDTDEDKGTLKIIVETNSAN